MTHRRRQASPLQHAATALRYNHAVTTPGLAGKRVLVLGAETGAGASIGAALANAGARLALAATTTEAGAAFAVQRLARRLAATSQAIDGTNETAVGVMVRQVAKQLGGLDAVVFCADLGPRTLEVFGHLWHHGGREMARSGEGVAVLASSTTGEQGIGATFEGAGARLRAVMVRTSMRMPDDVAVEVVRAVAGEAATR